MNVSGTNNIETEDQASFNDLDGCVGYINFVLFIFNFLTCAFSVFVSVSHQELDSEFVFQHVYFSELIFFHLLHAFSPLQQFFLVCLCGEGFLWVNLVL